MYLLFPDMKCLRIIHFALLILMLGCGSNRMRVAGSYYLERFSENGKFYLRQHGDRSTGGVFDGHLLQIGANPDTIIAYVKRLYRGDPDGWYMLDVRTGKVSGPLTECELRAFCNKSGITCEPVDAIWARHKVLVQRFSRTKL
jgi:hypothetical protein